MLNESFCGTVANLMDRVSALKARLPGFEVESENA